MFHSGSRLEGGKGGAKRKHPTENPTGLPPSPERGGEHKAIASLRRMCEHRG